MAGSLVVQGTSDQILVIWIIEMSNHAKYVKMKTLGV